MMSDRPKPKIELSTVQVVSSMAAAVTGAVLTSYLGDGGTILGTAVGSGASTAGFAVYKHYLVRTKEKVAPVIVEHARQWTPTGTLESDSHPAHQGGAARADVTRADIPRPEPTRADIPRPEATRADWEQARRTAPGWAQPTQAESGWGPDASQTRRDAAPTRQDPVPTYAAQYGTVRMGDGTMVNGGPGPGAPGGAGDGRHGKPGRGQNFWASRPSWFMPVVTAAAVFIVVLIAITFVELGTGKPISSSVWNRHDTGTTLGGSSGSTKTSTRPTPTQSATAPSSVGATGGVQSSAAPTTGPTPTATPTPSLVPTVGSSPGATVPGGAGAAGSATAVPGQ
jgi:hypothetical protein